MEPPTPQNFLATGLFAANAVLAAICAAAILALDEHHTNRGAGFGFAFGVAVSFGLTAWACWRARPSRFLKGFAGAFRIVILQGIVYALFLLRAAPVGLGLSDPILIPGRFHTLLAAACFLFGSILTIPISHNARDGKLLFWVQLFQVPGVVSTAFLGALAAELLFG